MSGEQVPISTAAVDRQERRWAVAAHLCGLLWLFGGGGLIFLPIGSIALFAVLGPLIIWKSKGDTMPFVALQAKEALNFQLSVLLVGIAASLFLIVGIGFLLLWILNLANAVFVIIAAIQAGDGKPYRYPYALRLVT